MAEQHLLHLVGRDVLAAPADGVLDPVDEAERAVGLAHHAIAAMEPEVAPGFDGLLGHAEVTGSEGVRLVGAQHQLPCLAGGQLHVTVIHDTRVEARPDPAHQTAARAVGFSGDDEIGLGRAVAFEQRHPGAAVKRLERLRRHPGPEADAHPVAALCRARRLGKQNRHHRAEQVNHRRATLVDRRPEARSGELRLENRRAADERRLGEGVERIDVEERQRGAQHVVADDAEDRRGVQAPPVVLRMRAGHALRWPGGA